MGATQSSKRFMYMKLHNLARNKDMSPRDLLTEVFDGLDTDGSGSLDRAEIMAAAETLGLQRTEAQVSAQLYLPSHNPLRTASRHHARTRVHTPRTHTHTHTHNGPSGVCVRG